MKTKVIAIIGKGGSGKTTLAKNICKQYNAHEVVRRTTRPPREGEVDGVDYIFTTPEDMAFNIQNYTDIQLFPVTNDMWAYGTHIDDYDKDKINVVVLNFNAIEQILQSSVLSILFVFVDAKDNIRLMRSIERENNPNCNEICRRFLADEKIDVDDCKGLIEDYDCYYINVDTTNKAPYDCAQDVWAEAIKYFK